MNDRQQGHLTEEQFSAALLDESVHASARAHLSTCLQCQADVDEFSLGLQDFRRTSHAWSEQRSFEMEALRPVHTPVQGGRIALAPAFAWGAAGLFAIGITLTTVGHLHREHVAPVSLEQVAEEDSPEQIARDNELLTRVNYELTRTDLPSAPAAVAATKAGRQP